MKERNVYDVQRHLPELAVGRHPPCAEDGIIVSARAIHSGSTFTAAKLFDEVSGIKYTYSSRPRTPSLIGSGFGMTP
jgi:hypothetical protein